MADLDRIKRNVGKMVGMNAPEADIDAYISEEGVTIDQVRAHRPGAAKEPAAEPSSFRRAQREAAESDQGALAASTVGGAQGWSLGASDEIMAGAFTPLEMAIGALTGEDADKGLMERARDAYARGLDLQRTQLDAARENHPAATFAGEVAGGAVTGGVGLGAAKTTAGRMAVGAAEGVGFGGVAGFNSGEGMEDRLERAETGAQIGAGVGAAFPIVGAAVGAAARGARRFAEPFTDAGRERIAARRFEDQATDPEALRRSLDEGAEELVTGSQPTTGQATGDMGVLAMERTAETRNRLPFAQRRADQNEARVDALGGIQPGGDPQAVASALRQRLQAIDDETQAALDAATGAAETMRRGVDERTGADLDGATRAAQEAAGAMGPGRTPDAAGDAMRGSLESARAKAKAQERALWAAVDPDGTLVAGTSNLRQAAADVVGEMPRTAEPLSPKEAALYQTAGELTENAPFRDVDGLRKRLNDALKIERRENGETQAYRRMSILRGALEKDLDGAIVQRVSQEAAAVARGEMSYEQTLEAGMLQWREGWIADRSAAAGRATGTAGPDSPARLGADGRSGSASFSRVPGTESEAGGGFRSASGDPRLSANDVEPNFDEAARDRLKAASTATRERAQTFDNATLAPIRQRPTAQGPYDMGSSAVPGQIFKGGARGYDSVETYRRAVGNDPEAMGAIRDFAIDSFQRKAMRPDGTIDPAKARTWRSMHKDALRAFPEVDAQIQSAAGASEQMAGAERNRTVAMRDAAKTTDAETQAARGRDQTLRDARAGRMGKLAEAVEPSDVTKSVGGVFSSQTPAQEMMKLRVSLGKDEAAREGLRKSVVDFMTGRFVGNTEAATSGVGTMKSDTFQGFVRQNGAALRSAGFSDDEIGVMDKIAEDLQRANRSVTAVRTPGSPNTAHDLTAVQSDDGPLAIIGKVAAGMAAGGLAGGGVGAAVGAVLAPVIGNARRAGLNRVEDIVADALLNPERARLLLTRGTGKSQERAMTRLAESYARMATVAGTLESESAPAVPTSADRERPASPRLTLEDRESPIENDLIDDGKAVMDGRPIDAPPSSEPARGGRVSAGARPEGKSDAEIIAEARSAIGRGAKVSAVRERLVSFGVDPEQAGL